MPAIPIQSPDRALTPKTTNPLPRLLHTPSGLAIAELQGTINFPTPGSQDDSQPNKKPRLDPTNPETSENDIQATQVGKLVFPLYDLTKPDDTTWMRKVYFYIGRHQRMTGEVRKLAKPIAVLRRRAGPTHVEGGESESGEDAEGSASAVHAKDELQVAEIVRYKILFTSRPEPVGDAEGGEGGG